jgi:MYXO-CTERM domain-containing protein
MRIILASVAVLFVALGAAEAGTVTHTASVDESFRTGPGGAGYGEITYGFTSEIPGFDGSLGVLDSMVVEMSGTLALTLIGGYESEEIVEATIGLSFGSEFSLKIATSDGLLSGTLATGVTPVLDIGTTIKSGEARTDGSSLSHDITAVFGGSYFFYERGGGETVNLIFEDLLKGNAGGTGSYYVPVDLADPSQGTKLVQDDLRYLDLDIWAVDHTLRGAATVTYHYTPTAVPLPSAGWAGLVLLGGLAVLRRRRRR